MIMERITVLISEIEQASLIREFFLNDEANLFMGMVFDIVGDLKMAAAIADAAHEHYKREKAND